MPGYREMTNTDPTGRSPEEQSAILCGMSAIEEASLMAPPPAARAAAVPVAGQYDDYWAENALAVLEREEITPCNVDQVRRRLSVREFVLGSSWGLRQIGRQGRFPRRHWYALKFAVAKRINRGLTELSYVEQLDHVPRIEHSQLLWGTIGHAVDRAAEMTLQAVAPLVGSDTLIVDLGSGWGRYSTLFSVAFPGIEVISGELTSSGRRSTQLLAEKGKLPIISVPFNYYEHSSIIDIIAASPRRDIIVFSSHSIEQVPYLDLATFNALLGIKGKCISFVHIEPVGWQIAGRANDARLSQPPAASPGPYAGYNRNLFVILLTLAAEEKITVEQAEPYYFAAVNTRNTGAPLVAHAIQSI